MSMPWEWSRWHRGTITLLSTIYLLNEYTDDEWNYEDVAATRAWLWGNTILWGPELFGGVATKVWGSPPAAYGSVAAGIALGIAGTYAAIEITADSPKQKKSMQASAKALFAPQFLGGESWEELDYFGTLQEGGSIAYDLIKKDVIKKKTLVTSFTLNLAKMVQREMTPRFLTGPYLPF